MKGRHVILATAAGMLMMLGAAQPARADHRDRLDNCYRKVEKEERKLDREVRRHGWHSRQAQHRREKIARLRFTCGGYGWQRDHRNDGRFARLDGRDHDALGCRIYSHRHDRHGSFFWFSGRWSFRR
jgi:hypothetical protein